jgi:hypothetical protein
MSAAFSGEHGSMTIKNHDPIPAIERAKALAVNIYDNAARGKDHQTRSQALALLAHLRLVEVEVE